MEYQHILLEYPAENIALITLSRIKAANALNQRMAEELADAIGKAQARALIITGAGERAFCAGADLKERKGMNKTQWQTQHAAFEKALHAILHCPTPIIAVVNGAAMGGGLELALACDFIYASKNATFGLPEATLGIMPGMGGVQTLARRVGVARAKELVFTGKTFSTNEALAWGVVNGLCDDVVTSAIEIATTIANNAPLAVAAVKRGMDEHAHLPLDVAMHNDLVRYNDLLETHDRQEGINAFNEKRKPVFVGE